MIAVNGRDFLFSEDCGFLNGEDGEDYRYSDGTGYFNGSDGSESYIYNDGSGYYHGADGSEGRIYDDGSAYYHGSDGTEAHRYSDGSGYYHGADGSDGYKYSDGSGYYKSADGSTYNYDAVKDDDYEEDETEEIEEDDSENASLGETLASLALLAGMFALTKHVTKQKKIEEEQRLEEERIAEEKRIERKRQKECRHKKLKACLFSNGKIAIVYESDYFKGKYYKDVLNMLAEEGFNNCKAIPIKDIYVDSSKYIGEVESVTIDGQAGFSKGTMIKYNSELIIMYHDKKEIKLPFNIKKIERLSVKQAKQSLLDLGFTVIHTIPLNDLITGWLIEENSVNEIIIDGVDKIKKGMIFEYDQPITITYHSFK